MKQETICQEWKIELEKHGKKKGGRNLDSGHKQNKWYVQLFVFNFTW